MNLMAESGSVRLQTGQGQGRDTAGIGPTYGLSAGHIEICSLKLSKALHGARMRSEALKQALARRASA